jgi:hypothetical protein
MTYDDLRTRVCRTLGIPTEDPSDEEYILVGDLLNEGVLNILSRTRLYVRCVHLRLLANQTEYEIQDDILRMLTLQVGASYLTQVARTQLDDTSYCIPGHNLIQFGLTPADGMTCEAWYVPRPTKMSNPGDLPADPTFGNIEEQFQPALINYTLWHAADSLDDTSSQSGERYRVLYEGQDAMGGLGTNLGAIKKAVNRRAMTGSRQRPLGDFAVFDSDPYLWVG